MVELSVIIASLKPRAEIEALDHLEREAFTDYEVIVRDDETVTKARNEGVERANADKLVFLDDDSRPQEGYLSRVSDILDREAAVAGRTIHPRDDVFALVASHYDFGDTGRYVTRFWGCNMAVRAEVFDAVGGWDEAITWGHEEKELATRVLEEYPIYYDPELVVHHSYAESYRDYWRKRYRLETQTPYYWDKQGVGDRRQWLSIAEGLLDPSNYVGRSLPHTAARFGGHVAMSLGRIRGMLGKS
ncbi:glycosyltransferase family 2 protein [Haloarchaeobius sp. HRN-SO-5]|uniref:glycosyltransferase family 2 protein n=1 Tax=Haloarchaeobius sp. HRN-SO-5 TaxID=3446118 RepID=UPI003EB9318A